MNLKELHTLGIDIGSTTVKIAILDEDNEVLFSDYERHFANIQETLSDLLGIAPAESVTGRSLAPAFRKEGRGQTQRDRLWLAYSSIHRALVMDGLKYIIYNVNGTITEQLFDLQNDPWEMTNLLAGTPSKKALKLAEKYRKVLNEEMRQANDFCDLDRPEGDHWSWWEKNEKISWTDGVNMYMFDK